VYACYVAPTLCFITLLPCQVLPVVCGAPPASANSAALATTSVDAQTQELAAAVLQMTEAQQHELAAQMRAHAELQAQVCSRAGGLAWPGVPWCGVGAIEE
jgi:hypothetical protein